MVSTTRASSSLGGFQLSGIAALIVVYGFAALPFNLSPLLIGTVIQDFAISEASAGLLISAELIAIAITTMVLSAKVEKLPIKPLVITATLGLAATNLLSAWPDGLTTLLVLRVVAGIAAGAMITVVYYLVGISSTPTRLYGIITVGNVFFGAVYLTLLPSAIEAWHFRGAFLVMATPLLLAVFLMSSIDLPDSEETELASSTKGGLGGMALLFVVAVFIIQAAQGGYYAFVELIGRQLTIDPETIGLALAGSYLLSLGGSSVAGFLGDRFGQLKPLFIGMTGHAIAVCLVVFAADQASYLSSIFIQALFFFLFLPYMLGLAASLDHSGHLSTMTGGTVMLGLGVGPLIAGNLVESWGYATIAYAVVTSVVIGYLIMLLVTRKVQSNLQYTARAPVTEGAQSS